MPEQSGAKGCLDPEVCNFPNGRCVEPSRCTFPKTCGADPGDECQCAKCT